MHGAIVDGGQREKVLPAVSLVVRVGVVRVVRVAVEALVAGGDELPRGQPLEVRAALGGPGQQPFPGLVAPATRLVGQLEGHDGWVLVVAQPGVPVEPGQHVPHIGAVAVLDGLGAVEQVVVGPGAVGVIGQAKEPRHVLGHAAVVRPVVHQREDQPDAQRPCLVDGVVERVEGGVVVHVRLRLQGRVTIARAIRERPGPHDRERGGGRVVERTVDDVVRLLMQVVGVGAAKPPGQQTRLGQPGPDRLAPAGGRCRRSADRLDRRGQPVQRPLPAEQLDRLIQRRGDPLTGHRHPDRCERLPRRQSEAVDQGG